MAERQAECGKVVVPKSLKFKLKVLMEREGRPVQVSKLRQAYRQAFKSELYPLDYGAASLMELLAEASSSINCSLAAAWERC